MLKTANHIRFYDCSVNQQHSSFIAHQPLHFELHCLLTLLLYFLPGFLNIRTNSKLNIM